MLTSDILPSLKKEKNFAHQSSLTLSYSYQQTIILLSLDCEKSMQAGVPPALAHLCDVCEFSLLS